MVPNAQGAWHNYLVPGTKMLGGAAYTHVVRPLVGKAARAALRVLDPNWRPSWELEKGQEEEQVQPREPALPSPSVQ